MHEIPLIVLALLWSSFFTGSEMGSYCVNRIRLRFRAQVGTPGARTLAKLLSDREMLVSTTLVGTNLGYCVATALCAAALTGLQAKRAELWSTLILAPVILIVAELIPKAVFAAHANAIMYRTAFLVRIATFALWPLVIVQKAIMVSFNSILGRSEPQGLGRISMPRLRHFIEEGKHEGVISPEQDRMARNVMRLERITLRAAMTPLDRTTAIHRNATDEELRESAKRDTYSRLPVYSGEKSNVVGVLALVEYLSEGRGRPIADFVRPPLELHESTPIDSALLRLRRAREPMGVVVGEDGKAVGIVTIKDLVEEIVGELEAW